MDRALWLQAAGIFALVLVGSTVAAFIGIA